MRSQSHLKCDAYLYVRALIGHYTGQARSGNKLLLSRAPKIRLKLMNPSLMLRKMTQFHFFSCNPSSVTVTSGTNGFYCKKKLTRINWKIYVIFVAITKRRENCVAKHEARFAFLNLYKILFTNKSSVVHLIEISCVCVQNLNEVFIHLKTFIFQQI